MSHHHPHLHLWVEQQIIQPLFSYPSSVFLSLGWPNIPVMTGSYADKLNVNAVGRFWSMIQLLQWQHKWRHFQKKIERMRETESNLWGNINKSGVIFYSYTCLQPQTGTLWIDCRNMTNISRTPNKSFSEEEEKGRVRNKMFQFWVFGSNSRTSKM